MYIRTYKNIINIRKFLLVIIFPILIMFCTYALRLDKKKEQNNVIHKVNLFPIFF